MPKSPSKTFKKKKYNARFPPARIKKIMQTDEEVGKVAAAVPVIISRALELFIESLITETSQTTQSKFAKTLSTAHIKQTIESKKQFDFLRGLVKSIPDHQTDESNGDALSRNGVGTGKKGRGRPRKQKGIPDAQATMGEPSRPSSDSSETEDDEEEEEDGTDTAEESKDLLAPSTSSVAASPFPVPLQHECLTQVGQPPQVAVSNGGSCALGQIADLSKGPPLMPGTSFPHPMVPMLPPSAFPPYPGVPQYAPLTASPYSCPVLPPSSIHPPVLPPTTTGAFPQMSAASSMAPGTPHPSPLPLQHPQMGHFASAVDQPLNLMQQPSRPQQAPEQDDYDS